jgi:hypothetical protein
MCKQGSTFVGVVVLMVWFELWGNILFRAFGPSILSAILAFVTGILVASRAAQEAERYEGSMPLANFFSAFSKNGESQKAQ